MPKLENTPIPVRLTIGFAAVLLLTLAVGLVGIRSARVLSDITVAFRDHPLAVADDMSRVRVAYRTMMVADRDAVLAETPVQLAMARAEITRNADIYTRSLLEARAVFPAQTDLFDRSLSTFDAFKRVSGQILDKAETGDREGARTLLGTDAERITRQNAQANIALFAASDRMAETFMEQARQSAARVEWLGTGLLGAAVILGAAVGFVTSRSITRPLHDARHCMEALTQGDLGAPVPGIQRGDELGRVARSIQVFKENLLRVRQMETAQKQTEAETAQRHLRDMRAVADGFESQMGSVVSTVIDAVSELRDAAQNMASTATQTSSQAAAVAGAAQGSSESVQAVATATGELSDQVAEITRLVDRSQQVADRADDQATRSSALIRALSGHVVSIGEIVALINDIASQTNLLALNATIEAARAGDAGKGFAVVAGEVKHLASQTSRATDDIASKIAAIQSTTADAVQAIDDIVAVVGEMSAIGGSVSSAVERQNAATGRISGNVALAARGSSDVFRNIAGVEAAAGRAGDAAARIMEASLHLSEQAGILKTESASFLDTVRAG